MGGGGDTGDEFIPEGEAKSCVAVMMALEVVNLQALKEETFSCVVWEVKYGKGGHVQYEYEQVMSSGAETTRA